MPEFICKLGTSSGEVVTRTIEAETQVELRTHLENEGFRIFSIEQPGSKTGFSSFTKQSSIKIEEFLLFNQQFSTLLRAGLPLLQALVILIKRQKQGLLRTTLEDVEKRICNGAALSEALTHHPRIFPRLYTASILAGERSGELDKVLSRYVAYAKNVTELRRKLKKTLTYPIILITASIALVTLLTTYVIPKFATLYDSSGSKLPWITQYVVGISVFTQNNIIWLGPLLIIIGTYLYFWRRTENGKRMIDSTSLKLPLIGNLIRQTTTARLTRSMATLIAGGLTLLESIEIASEVISNQVLSESMNDVTRKIREGQSLIDSLDQAGWLPTMAMDMIGVGEKSGALGPMLDEVASFYEAELELKLTSLTTLIEPLVLAFMGTVVLTVLLALYLPMLQFVGEKPAN